jgi:predicted ATPase
LRRCARAWPPTRLQVHSWAQLGRPYWLSLLVEAYGKIGQVEEGLNVLGEALTLAHKNGEHFWEAELYRLKGELLLMQAGRAGSRNTFTEPLLVGATEPLVLTEVDACFRQALDIARRQQAKSLELRAAMSLSRLWQQQGKRVDARKLLGL